MEGPPPPITKDLIRKALGKVKCGKDAMLKAAGVVKELTEVFFCNYVIPRD